TVAPHGLTGTQTLTVAGATPSGYNGTFTCTITGASTFTYPLASNPGAETVPGTFGSVPIPYLTGDIIIHSFSAVLNTTANITNGSNQLTNISSGSRPNIFN